MGFIRVLFSSPKRIAQTLVVFLAILAVPVTLVLVQQQQDLRQRASEAIPVTPGDYNADGNIKPGPPGYDAIFDPTQGGWVYVPITNNNSDSNPPTDSGQQIPFDCGGQNGCMCYSDGECSSGYCKKTTPDSENQLSPGTCDTRPAVDPCTQDTGRSNDCTCTTDPQCRSSFCEIASGSQSGTCKTPPTLDSNTNSDQIKIVLTKGSIPATNIAVSLKILVKSSQGGTMLELTRTTDTDGKATFDIPNSLSSSLCRDKGLSTTYCRYLERYFTRYFELELSITSSNIVFSDTNTNVKEISMSSSGNFPTDPLTFQITDNNPTPTPTPSPTPTGIPDSGMSITLTQPNGGEQIPAGVPYKVKWNQTSNIVKVWIEYYVGSGNGVFIADAINSSGTSGEYSWTPTTNLAGSGNVKIIIRGKADPASNTAVSDETNATFSISAPVTYQCDFDGQDGPDLKDYTIWLSEFKNGSTEKKSDCDRNGIIDIFDYAMWLGEFRKKNAAQ